MTANSRLALLVLGLLPGALALADVRIIDLPGSGGRVALRTERDAQGVSRSHYAISRDGVTFSRELSTTHVIRLRYAHFDPLIVQPEAGVLAADPAGLVRIVQFHTQPLPEYVAALESVGARRLAFLADNALVMRVPAESLESVRAQEWVRWVGPFHQAYKLEEELIAEFEQNVASVPERVYSIQCFERGLLPQQVVAERVLALGGSIQCLTPQGFRLEARLPHAALREIIALDEVQFVDRWGPPGHDMDQARLLGGAVPLLSGLGFTGQGVRGEVIDLGVRTSHLAFREPNVILHESNGGSLSHGTSTYGIVFGNGAVDFLGTGMLPDREQGIFAASGQVTQFGGPEPRHQHTAELVDPNGPYRAVFQSSSVGSSWTTQYSTISAEVDDYLFLYDLLSCQSQSNQGSQSSRPQAWAKNIVSVGGLDPHNTLSRADDNWTYASYGPAADGRQKPDLLHFNEDVYTTTSNNDSAYRPDFGGTSAATPIVAGHFGLVFQMWHEEVWPGHGGAATVFDSRPHSTTAKALLMSSAYRYPLSQGGLVRAKQGWGMPDLAKLYNERLNTYVVDENHLIAPLGVNVYTINVPVGTPEFRASLVYLDPAGTPNSNQHRINDLTLLVQAPGGESYWGNNGLGSSHWSSPGGFPNVRDTVEHVFVQNPTPGVWRIEVQADELVQDSHTETPQLDADYALVIVGKGAAAIGCPGDIDLSGQIGQSDLGILLAAFGSTIGQPGYDGQADLDADGQVGQSDLGILLGAFGASCE